VGAARKGVGTLLAVVGYNDDEVEGKDAFSGVDPPNGRGARELKGGYPPEEGLGTPPERVGAWPTIGGYEGDEAAFEDDLAGFDPPNGVGAFDAIGGYALVEDVGAPPTGVSTLLANGGCSDEEGGTEAVFPGVNAPNGVGALGASGGYTSEDILGATATLVVALLPVGGNESEEEPLAKVGLNPPNGVGAFDESGGYAPEEEDVGTPRKGVGALRAIGG
jgi:hypothetical protein